MTTTPDIFTNVHKGIRRALFEACLALGRAGDSREESAARQLLQEALRFVRHHGENEDLLLLPLLRHRAPAIAARMDEAHRQLDVALAALEARATEAPTNELHLRAGGFVALYLEHMREEEQEFEPAIRAALDTDALVGFARGSVERTSPGDQKMMLGSILPAIPRVQAEAFLKRMPPDLAEELSRLLGPAQP